MKVRCAGESTVSIMVGGTKVVFDDDGIAEVDKDTYEALVKICGNMIAEVKVRTPKKPSSTKKAKKGSE